MGWFSRKPTQEKYAEAVVTVGTNLYLSTTANKADAPVPLRFELPDSRYRYLIFCLTTATMAALVYDEKKEVQPQTLIQACLRCARLVATEFSQDYFDDPAASQEYIGCETAYFEGFLKEWSKWPDLETGGKNAEVYDLICCMIRSTESNEPAEEADNQRLGRLALQIDCQMPVMREAFVELAKR